METVTKASHFSGPRTGRIQGEKLCSEDILTNPAQSAFATKRMLPVMEWMAENAYIPPGMHRLMAAGGLAIGLWGGRSFMDMVVARDHSTGKKIDRDHAPQLFRPIHGIMSYNPYSDAASDRWKSVVDKFVPAITGGVMAYYGGKHYFHGKGPGFLGGGALHPLSYAARENLANFAAKLSHGKMSSHTLETVTGSVQADYLRKVAGGTYGAGATIGTDKLGGMFLGNHNMWADSFAVGAGIKPRLPFLGALNRKLFGNFSTASVNAARSMRAATTWAQGNIATHADINTWLTDEALRKWATDGVQAFGAHGKEYVDAVMQEMRAVITRADSVAQSLKKDGALDLDGQKKLFVELAGQKDKPGLIDQGMDHLLNKAQVDWSKFNPGNNGIFTAYARMFGSAKKEAAGREAFKEYLVKSGFNNAAAFDASAPKLTGKQAATLWGSTVAALGTVVGLGSVAAHNINKHASKTVEADGENAVVINQYKAPGKGEPRNVVEWVNGTPLNMAEWASRMVIVPPSMHRLMSAGYLSAALYTGMKVADAMTGRKLPLLRSGALSNSLLTREQISAPLRPLYGILKYTPGSSQIADRWRMAAHYLIPVAFGMAGTYTGSAMYFADRKHKLETPKTLEDYTDRILMEQSKPFAGITALTSIFNTGSGIHLLPVFNYSSNLQSRYVMGAGLQVATPGLGKWWSGNEGLTPWGTKKTLAYIGAMLGENPAQRPRELPALVHSVLAKLYPDMPEVDLLLKKREFIRAIHSVRDTYFVDGAIPPQKKEELSTKMKELVTGEGFENLLRSSGFDLTQANLASNGVSGHIANLLGKRGTVHKLEDQYRQSFAERTAKSSTINPRDYLQKLANHTGEATTNTANDNQHRSFAEKVKSPGAPAQAAELG